MISTTEYLLLSGVLLNGNRSYGKEIFESAEQLATENKVSLSYGSIYPTLERLVEEKLLKSEMGQPSQVRGGKARRFYSVTGAGIRAIKEFESMTVRVGNRLREVLV